MKIFKRILGWALALNFFPLMFVLALHLGDERMTALESYAMGWGANLGVGALVGLIFLLFWLLTD